MTFEEILDQVIAMLQRRGRVTYRTLQLQFQLDEDHLAALKDELLYSQPHVVDDAGRGLVWTGDTASVALPAPALAPEQAQAPLTSTPPSLAEPILTSRAALAGERRQVTVLFADISGFAALAETLDPEQVRQVMNACFAQLGPVVEAYGGTIDKFIGDEIMALFGAPIAHGNEAERAVHTALGLLEALAAFNRAQGTTLGLHGGINTGLVIAGGIGTPSRQDYSVMGDAVNLAARLADASERGQIFVGPETYRLTRTLFRYEPLAPMALKGKTDPVQVYQVLGLRDVPEFHETDAATRRPLVGRVSELTLLLDRWADTTQGLGQVVVLSGEAGIGKSRLAAALGERVVQEGHRRITLRCSPYHTNSALYPIMAHVERLLQGPGEEPAAAKGERLEQLLQPTGLPLEHVVPLIAALVAVPLPEGRYPPLRLSPPQQKQQTLEALVTWLLAETARQPVLSVWEDLHWADPSTLELLELLLRQVPTARLLLVVTCRPPFQPPWGVRSYVTPLMLSRLGPQQMAQLVAHVTAGKALPPEVMRQVIIGTDGVPLFVEECVKMILESSLVREEHGQYVLTGPLPSLAIPSTLQDILMARLDHLAPVKAVAQLGATVGREFTYELLAAISPLDEPVLQHGLSQLVEAELLYQRGYLPQAQYIFKHALIQEAAYQSLLKSTQQQYHQRIAQVLTAQFPETAETQPELLAHHYTEAGLPEQAMPYWRRAGEQAGARSAHAEAIAHLTQGLDVLQRLPDTPSRAQHELDFQTMLGRALAIVRGHAAPETAHAYARARELCRHGGDPARLFDIQVGLREFYLNRGELHTARELAEVCLGLAQGQLDPASRMRALFGLGSVLHALGEFAQGRDYLEQAIALYTPHQDRSLTGQAPLGVPCLARLASTLWHLGYPRQALARNRAMLTLAHELSDAYNLVRARCYAAEFYHLLGEVVTAQEQAEAALSLSTEQAFPPWGGAGMFWRGWGWAVQGRSEEGMAAMRQGLDTWQATGSVYSRPTWLALLAEAHRGSGQVEEGLHLVAEALALSKDTGMRSSEAELYRLQGALLLQQEVPDEGQAEAGFHHALDVARQQQAKSLELRAAISLSRLWQRQGKPEAARPLLAESYGWFTEGFDTADLREAKTLLDALA